MATLKAVKAKVQDTVKYKKVDGTLILFENEVSWVPSSADNGKKFQCLYSDIKMQRISPETSSKVQLQILQQDDTSNNFHFANPKGRATQMQERNVIKDLLAELIPLHRQKATKDLEEKSKIFKEKPALHQLYKELVVSNIITAQEFWESQKLHINAEEEQEVGIASGFLADLKPDMHGCNELRFNLTADNIMAIFKMYPAVKEKYMNTVPHETTEKEFWTEFFKSQHFHRDRAIKTAAKDERAAKTSKDVFGDLARKDEEEMLSRSKEVFTDPLINFSNPCPNVDEGYGRKINISVNASNDTLIRQFNHQSMMVLQRTKRRLSSDSDNNYRKKRIREVIENHELEDIPDESSSGNVLEMDKFAFNSMQGKTNGHVNGSYNSGDSNIANFRKNVTQWTPQLSKVLTADVAKNVLGEVSPGGKYMQNTSRTNYRETIPSDLQNEMKKNYLTLAELLRHFWVCFPAKTLQLEEKVRRMANAIEKYRDTKLMSFTCTLPSHCLQLSEHMNEMVNIALKKFSMWEERKSGVKVVTIS